MLGNIIAGGEIIGNLAGGERRYFVKDHLGSVRTTVDRNGNVVGHDDYYPFGLAMPGRGSNSANPNGDYKFTGYEKDDEARLDLYHANARGYDPVLGRFMQIDPMSDLFPHVSSYAYGNNNPLRFTDPTGMAPYDWIRNNETGEYTWDWNVTSSDNTPEGHTYVGKGIDDIQADYKESTSLLGRMFGSGPDIDWESIGAVVKPYNESDYVTSIGIADNPGSFFAGGPVGVLKKLSTGYKAIQAAKGSTKLLTQGRFPNFAKKFTKHSGEWSQWGSISKNAFYNRAVKLADSPVGGSIRGFTSKQGYSFRFNSRTGEFLTTKPSGTIETFFRPKQGLDYYLKQVQLYGN